MENTASCFMSWETERDTSLTLAGLEDRVALVLTSAQTESALFTIYDYFALGSINNYDLSNAELIDIFGELCKTLAAVHDRNIVHADIKPDNILLTKRDGKVFPILADLGLCQDVTHMQVMSRLGTPVYMAPEIWNFKKGGVGWGASADIYALGLTLHELYAKFAWFEVWSNWEGHKREGFNEEWFLGIDADYQFDRQFIKDLVFSCCKADPAERPSLESLADNIQNALDYVEVGGDLSDPVDLVYEFMGLETDVF